jgi:type VI protein secretion system component VasK
MLRTRALPALVALALLGGCAVGSSAPPASDAGTLGEAVAEATSAVETTRLAARLLRTDRASAAVVDTTIDDSVHVLSDASFALSTLVPGSPTAAAWRDDALDAVAEAIVAVSRARDWANGVGDAAQVRTDLDASARRLDDLGTELEQAAGA